MGRNEDREDAIDGADAGRFSEVGSCVHSGEAEDRFGVCGTHRQNDRLDRGEVSASPFASASSDSAL